MRQGVIDCLRVVCQYRIHRYSYEVSRATMVFDELISEGFLDKDQDGYFQLTRNGECLKDVLDKYEKRFGRAPPKGIEEFLREKATRA